MSNILDDIEAGRLRNAGLYIGASVYILVYQTYNGKRHRDRVDEVKVISFDSNAVCYHDYGNIGFCSLTEVYASEEKAEDAAFKGTQ